MISVGFVLGMRPKINSKVCGIGEVCGSFWLFVLVAYVVMGELTMLARDDGAPVFWGSSEHFQ